MSRRVLQSDKQKQGYQDLVDCWCQKPPVISRKPLVFDELENPLDSSSDWWHAAYRNRDGLFLSTVGIPR